MRVGELIEVLQEFDPQWEVVLSKDGEGNQFSPAEEVTPQKYVAESTWSGYLVSQDADDYDDDEEFVEALDSAENVVLIWPVN